MYSKGCVHESCFAADVRFTDPAAETRGFLELAEAFRALKWLHPVQEDFAIVQEADAAETDAVDSGRVCIDLWQRYTLPFKQPPLRLYSRVVARYDASSGRITSVEECWRGVPLLSFAPCAIARRLNGIVSFYVTRGLLPDADESE